MKKMVCRGWIEQNCFSGTCSHAGVHSFRDDGDGCCTPSPGCPGCREVTSGDEEKAREVAKMIADLVRDYTEESIDCPQKGEILG
jgi:hypothetical protein